MVSRVIRLAKIEKGSFEFFGIAGGLALNIVATSDAARKNNLSKLYVPPFPNDSGLAYGNCVAGALALYGSSSVSFNKLLDEFTAFNGPIYSETDYAEALSKLPGQYRVTRLNESEYISSMAQI